MKPVIIPTKSNSVKNINKSTLNDKLALGRTRLTPRGEDMLYKANVNMYINDMLQSTPNLIGERTQRCRDDS
jgi:hypothetical protein